MRKISHKRLLNLLQQISLAVDQAETTDKAFAEVLGHICRFMGWPMGHVYVWSEAANALVSSRIWYLEDPAAMAPFRALSEATAYKRDEGTLGLVWVSGQAISILDVRGEPIFVRQLPVEEGGVRAYFAFPVFVEDEVAAVLEFFSPESVSPGADMTSVINHVSALLGLAMQRQQTMIRLQHSEAQLAEAQRTAHVGHWDWDILKDEVTWSPELFRIYGVAPDSLSLTYDGVHKLTHPDDLAYVLKKVTEAYEEGRSFNYFHRIIRPDGAVRVIHSRGRPIYDQAGQIVRLHGTVQDMTEQKEAELKLADTVRQLSAMMEIGQTVSATLDLEEIYEQVLTLVRPLIGAETVLLLLYKDDALEIVAVDQEDVPDIPDMRGMRVPIESSIAGEAWQSGESLFLKGEECVRMGSTALISQTGYQPQATLTVPVRWQDNAVGVLAASHRDANAFEEEDLRLLEMAAAWTAIAIANARQYEQLQRRLRESDAIVTISNALTTTLELDEMLQLIVNQTHNIVPHADWTAIHLLQADGNELEMAAAAGLEIEAEAYQMRVGEGLAGYVMATGEVINVADVQDDVRRLPIDERTKARSLVVAPVESGYGRIGTISMQCAEAGMFGTDDERLLVILGVQAGMAIENARLYAAQQRARARAELQRERMWHMARRVVAAQEEERGRIARELHDESGQSLTSLKISLSLLRNQVPEDVQETLDGILELTDQTMSNLRLLSHNLRPPGLDAYGLDAALAGLCQDFETHTRLTVVYEGREVPDLAALAALSLYRFAQEALTNVAKHAEATEVRVTLAPDSDKIRLTIVDNGRGFVVPDFEERYTGNGTGLLGMLERLEMADGQLQIDSTAAQGSCLTAIVPYIRETK
jgi:PAS domain S-box-containing protein